MIDYMRNDLITHSMVSQPGMGPPPPYSSIALEGDQMVYSTTSKTKHTIDDTYLTMDEFHTQFTSLECTNQLLVSGFNRWIRNRGKALTKARHLIDSYYNQEEDAYIDLLDRMTSSVLLLLDEAHAALNRKVTTRRRNVPFTITTAIDALGTRMKKRSKLPPPAFVLDQSSRYQTSQQKLNQTFELLLDQVNSDSDYAKKENKRRSAVYCTPTQSPRSIRRSSLPPPSLTPSSPPPVLEKHAYRYDNDHHHYDDYSPPPSPLPRQTMELSYWALYDGNNSDEDEDLEEEDDDDKDALFDNGVIPGSDTILTTATSRSVKMVHSCLSPLLRLASPKYSASEDQDYSLTLPSLSSSTSSSSLVSSSSSSYSLSSLASSSSLQHTTPPSSLHHSRCKQLYRIAFNALVISRLLLHRHHHPSSSFNSSLHLLRPQHQHLWRQYLLVVFGSSLSPLPYMCDQLSRLFFLIQFTYRISS